MKIRHSLLGAFLAVFGLSACGIYWRQVQFKQTYSSYNGTVVAGVYYYDHGDDLAASWVRSALSEQAFNALYSSVARGNALVVFTSGASQAANGQVKITRITMSSGSGQQPGTLRVWGDVDSVGKSCPAISATSFPFAVAIVPRLQNVRAVSDEAIVRYVPAGCKVAAMGVPHNDYLPPQLH